MYLYVSVLSKQIFRENFKRTVSKSEEVEMYMLNIVALMEKKNISLGRAFHAYLWQSYMYISCPLVQKCNGYGTTAGQGYLEVD